LEKRTGKKNTHRQLRVRYDIPGTIGRNDFGASQGAKNAYTGRMEAMSDAGVVQERPGPTGEAHLWSGGSLLLSHIVPLCFLVAPRPDHKSGSPNCPGYVVTDPNEEEGERSEPNAVNRFE